MKYKGFIIACLFLFLVGVLILISSKEDNIYKKCDLKSPNYREDCTGLCEMSAESKNFICYCMQKQSQDFCYGLLTEMLEENIIK